MNDFETGVCVGYLLHKGDGSSIILDTFTTAQNGHWTAQSGHAWNDITVNVPTYEQEYRQMQAACEEVKDTIKPYDPTLPDPWDPIHDPTQPTIPEEIDKIAGYEFPPDVPYDPTILDAVGSDPITDVNTGQTIHCELTENEGMHGVTAWYTDANGNYYHINGIYSYNPDTYYTDYKCTMQDPTTGMVHITWTQKSHADPSYSYTYDFTQVVPELIGYGASGHTYKVHNN